MHPQSITIPLTQGSTMVYIYALTDPRTGDVRYVGKAANPKLRLRGHLRKQEIQANTHKARWLRTLLADGLLPSIVVLESVPADGWQEHEQRWIAYYRALGANLTNSTSGGDGIDKGTKHRPESVAKIRAALIGRPVSEETREKIRARHKGKPLTTEHRAKLSDSHKQHWATLSGDEKARITSHLRHEWTEDSRKKLAESNRGHKHGKTTSAFHGVSWFKRDGCWRAWVRDDNRQLHLGYFTEAADAARAYDRKAQELKGANAILNFPV